ncbi:hypothetical protein IAT38_007036 [Cryptococcus sp. DSM 104549]
MSASELTVADPPPLPQHPAINSVFGSHWQYHSPPVDPLLLPANKASATLHPALLWVYGATPMRPLLIGQKLPFWLELLDMSADPIPKWTRNAFIHRTPDTTPIRSLKYPAPYALGFDLDWTDLDDEMPPYVLVDECTYCGDPTSRICLCGTQLHAIRMDEYARRPTFRQAFELYALCHKVEAQAAQKRSRQDKAKGGDSPAGKHMPFESPSPAGPDVSLPLIKPLNSLAVSIPLAAGPSSPAFASMPDA